MVEWLRVCTVVHSIRLPDGRLMLPWHDRGQHCCEGLHWCLGQDVVQQALARQHPKAMVEPVLLILFLQLLRLSLSVDELSDGLGGLREMASRLASCMLTA